MIRRNDVLIAQFAECAEMIQRGASVAACLDRFPEHAAQLEPMLVSVTCVRDLHAVPFRSAELAAESRASFMAEATRLAPRRTAILLPLPWWQRVFTIFQPTAYGAPRRGLLRFPRFC